MSKECKGKEKGHCKEGFCKVSEKLKEKGKEPKAGGCCPSKKDAPKGGCCPKK